MDREGALNTLGSEKPNERLRAARVLARHATAEDWDSLQAAYAAESVPWVKNALRKTLARISGTGSIPDASVVGEDPVGSDLEAEVYSQAVEETAGALLHEFTGPIGHAREAAKREVPDYPNSGTKKHLDRLTRVVDAVQKLQHSASPPRLSSFDLSQLVTTTIRDCLGTDDGHRSPEGIACRPDGPLSLIIRSDSSLVAIAISNGISNAAEAVRAARQGNDPSAIVVSWGSTEREHWISIIDRGTGLPPGFQRAFDFGVSSKTGHLGVGLALAKRAISSLGGSITLRPAEGQGCHLEITLPKQEAEEQCEYSL